MCYPLDPTLTARRNEALPIAAAISTCSNMNCKGVENVFDGNKNTFCHTNGQNYPFIYVKYSEIVTISSVTIVNRNDLYGSRTKNLYVTITNTEPQLYKISGIKSIFTLKIWLSSCFYS